jgi:Rho-binding antiterminator
MDDYQPINCEFHDLLEAAATRRQRILIEYLDEAGQPKRTSAMVVDVKSKEGAEYLYTDDSSVIRLDRLVAVDGRKLADY